MRIGSGDSLSAVYSFFAPDQPRRSLGTYMVYWLVERAAAGGLPHVYLGYWIEECAKMAYKVRFRPVEILGSTDGWRRIPAQRRSIGSVRSLRI